MAIHNSEKNAKNWVNKTPICRVTEILQDCASQTGVAEKLEQFDVLSQYL